MKTKLLFTALLIALVPAHAAAEPALPKEGSGNTTSYYTGSGKRMDAGKEHAVINYDALGISTNDAGQGFLHAMSWRCMGSVPATKGEYEERGVCLIVDKDGDQVFGKYTASGRIGAPAKGTLTFVGGTGKYAGIDGTAEWTRTPLRPVAADGTFHSVIKHTYKYKLP